MTWNYRIVKYKNTESWGLHEVYYNSKDEPCGMTDEPCRFYSDESVDDLRKAIKLALNGAEKHPILKEPDKWASWD